MEGLKSSENNVKKSATCFKNRVRPGQLEEQKSLFLPPIPPQLIPKFREVRASRLKVGRIAAQGRFEEELKRNIPP
jgi:hypothetical protein